MLFDLTMPMEIDGQLYYRTIEVCRSTGVSPAMIFRLIQQGIFSKMSRDRRGWIVFTEDDVNIVRAATERSRLETKPSAAKSGK